MMGFAISLPAFPDGNSFYIIFFLRVLFCINNKHYDISNEQDYQHKPCYACYITYIIKHFVVDERAAE